MAFSSFILTPVVLTPHCRWHYDFATATVTPLWRHIWIYSSTQHRLNWRQLRHHQSWYYVSLKCVPTCHWMWWINQSSISMYSLLSCVMLWIDPQTSHHLPPWPFIVRVGVALNSSTLCPSLRTWLVVPWLCADLDSMNHVNGSRLRT